MISFICEHCAEQNHASCKGKSQCDCHHRTDVRPEPATGKAGE